MTAKTNKIVMKFSRIMKLIFTFLYLPCFAWIGYTQGMLHYYMKKNKTLNAQYYRYMDSVNHIMNKNPWRAKVFLDSAKEVSLQLDVIREKVNEL